MTILSNANTSGPEYAGHIVWWKAGGVSYYPEGEAFTVSKSCRVEPLVTAASAQAAIDAEKAKVAELEAETDALTKALTGLTCGGSEFFTRRGDRYVADIKACVDWVRRAKTDAHRRSVEAIKRATAAEARADRLAEIASKLSAAISWLDYPFIDNRTPEPELRQRVGFMMKDAEPHRAALQQETQP